jgi:hypothetical protein
MGRGGVLAMSPVKYDRLEPGRNNRWGGEGEGRRVDAHVLTHGVVAMLLEAAGGLVLLRRSSPRRAEGSSTGPGKVAFEIVPRSPGWVARLRDAISGGDEL